MATILVDCETSKIWGAPNFWQNTIDANRSLHVSKIDAV